MNFEIYWRSFGNVVYLSCEGAQYAEPISFHFFSSLAKQRTKTSMSNYSDIIMDEMNRTVHLGDSRRK